MKKFEDQPCRLPYDEWSRRQIVVAFMEKYQGQLSIDDLPKIENYCINGVFEPTEIFKEFHEYQELKNKFNSGHEIEDWAERFCGVTRQLGNFKFRIINHPHQEVTSGCFINVSYTLDEILSIISNKDKFETFKSDCEKFDSYVMDIKEKYLELKSIEAEKQSILTKINHQKKLVRQYENKLKNLEGGEE